MTHTLKLVEVAFGVTTLTFSSKGHSKEKGHEIFEFLTGPGTSINRPLWS